MTLLTPVTLSNSLRYSTHHQHDSHRCHSARPPILPPLDLIHLIDKDKTYRQKHRRITMLTTISNYGEQCIYYLFLLNE